MLGSACGFIGPDDVAPQLVSVHVYEGLAPCRGCPVGPPAREITPGPDNVLTVSPGVTYTFRAVVRTSGNRENCVYNVFHIGWDPPDRTFDCLPELDEELTLDRVTGSLGVPTDDSVVTLNLTEYEIARRTLLSSNDVRTYTVHVVAAEEAVAQGSSREKAPGR